MVQNGSNCPDLVSKNKVLTSLHKYGLDKHGLVKHGLVNHGLDKQLTRGLGLSFNLVWLNLSSFDHESTKIRPNFITKTISKNVVIKKYISFSPDLIILTENNKND